MVFGFGKKTTMPARDEALPGRDHTPVPGEPDARRARHPARGAVARRVRGALRRDGLLLGRGADLLAAARRHQHGGRLHGRLHAQPDLRGDLHRPDRPRRDRARRLRPRRTSPGAAAQGVLGEPRPDDGQPAGQRHRHRLPVGDLLDHPGPAGWPRRPRATPSRRCSTTNGYGEISTEIRSAEDAGPFYLAEDYHQGYLHKNPGGYCNHGPNG